VAPSGGLDFVKQSDDGAAWRVGARLGFHAAKDDEGSPWTQLGIAGAYHPWSRVRAGARQPNTPRMRGWVDLGIELRVLRNFDADSAWTVLVGGTTSFTSLAEDDARREALARRRVSP
jgi:hypothetical protein